MQQADTSHIHKSTLAKLHQNLINAGFNFIYCPKLHRHCPKGNSISDPSKCCIKGPSQEKIKQQQQK